jgi:DNA polymerase III subunit chi
MAEVWFYHLEQKTVEQELPGLLQRGLDRELRMAVFVPDVARAKTLSERIWGHEDVAFLAHGLDGEEGVANQPIVISASGQAANSAGYAFYVHGATPTDISQLDRASILFDGRDDSRVQQARDLWKRFKGEGAAIKYWKQDDEGRWKDMAIT